MATINLTTRDDDFSDNDVGNRINAFAGDDIVRGNGGADRIFGGLGDDGLFGGNGDDRLFDRTEERVSAFNRMVGGAGNDLLEFKGASEYGVSLEAIGGDGSDTLRVGSRVLMADGGIGNDRIDAVAYVGEIFGGGGNDTINAAVIEGRLAVEGGAGNDVIRLEDMFIEGRLTADGGAGNDTIFAAGETTLTGGPGRDLLVINGGDLVRFAEPDFPASGRDQIQGFDASSTIDVSPIDADDRRAGTQDFDFVGQDRSPGVGELGFYRSAGDTVVTLNFGEGVEEIGLVGFTGALSTSDFSGVQQNGGQKQGTDQNDRLVGTPGPDRIDARGGDDFIDGRGGNDRLVGGSGRDTVLGGAGDDELLADNGGPDGFSRGDRLIGGDGKDRLDARGGSISELVGGPGRDSFLVGFGFGEDREGPANIGQAVEGTISDFESGETIDVSVFDADLTTLGNQSFEFIGRNAFTEPGQLRFDRTGADLVVQTNTDMIEDGILEPKPELELALPEAEVGSLLRSDFVL